jgi:hypothetical protein
MRPLKYDKITYGREMLPAGLRGFDAGFAGISDFILPGTGH